MLLILPTNVLVWNNMEGNHKMHTLHVKKAPTTLPPYALTVTPAMHMVNLNQLHLVITSYSDVMGRGYDDLIYVLVIKLGYNIHYAVATVYVHLCLCDYRAMANIFAITLQSPCVLAFVPSSFCAMQL